MSHDLLTVLRDRFGFGAFRPGQLPVIEHLLAGRSAAAVFPTGGGKSLCYQLPALLLEGVTLVVSPLIALMKDQIDALAARGIAARRLDSTLTADEYRGVMDDVRGGRLRMLYVAPERFNNERFRETIQRIRVSLFAVDEAHCISEWGHNFRPDYLKLTEFARLCGAPRRLALTATATPQVLADVCREFAIATECAIRTGFYRPNLQLLATPLSAEKRDAELIAQLRARPIGPTIVYVTLQRTAEEVAQRLAREDFAAKPYHAGMDTEERTAVQDWFLASERGIVVATIAFGMGIDKRNIRYVYHYNLPKSLENYSQEVGRAGRDGEPSICHMFACGEDLNVLENFAYGDTPSLADVRELLGEVFSLGESFDVSEYELSDRCDIRVLVVKTLLTYLELDGYLQGGTPFYSAYQFKPLMSSADILAKFDDERRDFLRRLFQQAKKAKTWVHIDVDQAAKAIECPRERVVRALDYLGEQQMLELRAEGVRHRYRRLKAPADIDVLARTLHDRTLLREAREIARLRQVVDWVRLDACQVGALAGHFGEPREQPCGHCSWCMNDRKAASLAERPAAKIDGAIWQQAGALRRTYPDALSNARCVARLLCGTPSPKLTRAKLSSHTLFGALSHVPFQEVLERAQRELAGAPDF
jgi:ATP-dependent DNA helicase RecQ